MNAIQQVRGDAQDPEDAILSEEADVGYVVTLIDVWGVVQVLDAIASVCALRANDFRDERDAARARVEAWSAEQVAAFSKAFAAQLAQNCVAVGLPADDGA